MNHKNHEVLERFRGFRAISEPVSIELSQNTIKCLKCGSSVRVMYLMMYFTGCRGEEMDRMEKSNIIRGFVYWHPLKHQKGFRKEQLPIPFLEELEYYWKSERISINKVFGIGYATFCRYFNKLRPNLPNDWNEKKEILRNNTIIRVNKYCLNGLRKTFLTSVFGKEYNTYRDSGMALEMTSQRALHSKTNMTSYHYLRNMGELRKSKYWGFLPCEVSLMDDKQDTLLNFI